MLVSRSIPEIRATVSGLRARGDSIALISLSRALHAGHLALIARAKDDGHRVIVALDAAPMPDDAATLATAGVDAVFAPHPAELSPPEAHTAVNNATLAKALLGRLLPGHFRAVATKTARLFNIIQPDAAYHGEKDYQELCLLRDMCRDLHIPVRIIGVSTQRDADGLALSTRNADLTPADRAAATCLPRALAQAEALAQTGITASRLRAWVAAHIQAEPRANLQSIDIRDADTLQTIAGPLAAPAVLLLAVKFGRTLLIDQRVITVAPSSVEKYPGGELAAGQEGAGPFPPHDTGASIV